MKLKTFLIKLIDFYQRHISALIGPACVFYPTCSAYTKEAIVKYGAWKGSYLGILRILRCHPWQTSRFDPLK